MDEFLLKLCNILEKQLEIYKKDLELSELKKAVIIANRIDELVNLNKKEQGIMYQLVDLESDREKVTLEISKILNKDINTLTILDIAQNITNNQISEKLKNIRLNLLEVVEEIKIINNMNKKLIDSSIEYIDFNINLMLGSGGQETYGSQGNIQDINAGFKAFDKKM